MSSTDLVLNELKSRWAEEKAEEQHEEYECIPLTEWIDDLKDTLTDKWIIPFVDFHHIVHTMYCSDEIETIVYVARLDKKVITWDEIGKEFPNWNNKEYEFFDGHPSKNDWYIVRKV